MSQVSLVSRIERTSPCGGRKGVVHGVALFGAGQAVALASGLIVQVIVGRALGPADYGRFVIVHSIGLAALTVLMGGAPGALRQYISVSPRALRLAWQQVWVLQMPIAAGFALILTVSAPLVCHALDEPRLFPGLSVVAIELTVRAGALEPCWYLLNGLGCHRMQAVLMSGYSVLRPVCVACLLWLSPSVVGALAGLFVAAAVSLLLALPILARMALHSPPMDDESVRGGLRLHVARWVHLGPVADAFNYLLVPANLWLLKALSEEASHFAVYSACYILAQAILPFGLVLSRAYFAHVAGAYAAGRVRQARVWAWRVVRISMIATVLGTVVALAAGDHIVGQLWGSSFRGSGVLLGLLCLGTAAIGVHRFLCDMLAAVGRLKIRLALCVAIAAATVPATAFMAKIGGASGAAWALAMTGSVAVAASAITFHFAARSTGPERALPQGLRDGRTSSPMCGAAKGDHTRR
ncbi:MAG TPA: hypothetical protein EYP56_05570 [Planctomycetaceae bacterium]|nr:hypothetical protein [Planctomycetaceae bacterium]HIQ19810.1 hypothetical protein [Planctomycetota bacterium]